ILYFQRLQYGVLDNCLEHEPWLVAWTSERLEMKAQYILSEGRLLTRYGGGEDIKGRSPQAARKKPQKRGRKDSVPPRGRSVDGESKQVSKERRSRGRTTSPPLTRRSSRRGERSKSSPRGVDQQKPSAEPAEGNLNQDKGTHETPVSIVPDAGTLSVAQVKHEEWEFDGQGRIIEDMVKVTMPAYEHTKNGLPHFYPSIPQQHNGCDCSVFVIKFIQFWSLDKPLQHWDKDVVQEFRKEIILDIVMGPHNSEIGKALEALDGKHVRRNQPRKKTKAVRSPFTAPSTKSMLQRAGLPTRKPNKGGRQRKKNF
ncbi:hypothetical protein S83_054297, partial [Arachis hypogaea]